MIFYIVNAFTDDLFGGNTAGVVINQSLPDDIMQKIARELRFSETAFVSISNKDLVNIRYFTPVSEVDLCGHATIASFEALKEMNILKKSPNYCLRTKAGILKVFNDGEDIFMEQGKPRLGGLIQDSDELASILNINPSKIGDKNFNLVPQIVSTGLMDIMLPIRDKQTLLSIKPDFVRLALYSKKHQVVGVHAFTLEESEHNAICRNFAPLYGIDEEAATGTSNGALTHYLHVNSAISSNTINLSFLQGLSLGRPSIIKAKITASENPGILIGGRCRILSKGKLFL